MSEYNVPRPWIQVELLTRKKIDGVEDGDGGVGAWGNGKRRGVDGLFFLLRDWQRLFEQ